MTPRRHAIFLRPSLGIGGAERLMVDAAMALQARGWSVEFVVNFFDPDRTQTEARTGQVNVTVFTGLPEWCARGRFRALTAVAGQRMLLERLRRRGPAPDLIVCDLVPHAAGWIRRWLPRSAILVYCHFPDRLAVAARGPYGLYRALIGRWEDRGMRVADRVVVNSDVTAAAARRAFPFLDPARIAVVHPGVRPAPAAARHDGSAPLRSFLSVARIDSSKNLPLAIEAFAAFHRRVGTAEYSRWRLVLAGGYDRRLPEARALMARLRTQAADLGVLPQVEWRFDLTPADLEALWREAFALIHFAPAEHFGIVLIEAMARGLPVLAVAAGGPAEIVVDGVTGALRPPEAMEFSAVMAEWAGAPQHAAVLGAAGHARATAEFSIDRFSAGFAAQAEAALGPRP